MGAFAVVLQVLILFVGLFLILIILLQRGRGGGLAGALGGMGGQSAFGTKAGDVFTWVTVGTATVWVLLAGVGGCVMRESADTYARQFASDEDRPDPRQPGLGVGDEGLDLFGAEEDMFPPTGGTTPELPVSPSTEESKKSPAPETPAEGTPQPETPAADSPTADPAPGEAKPKDDKPQDADQPEAADKPDDASADKPATPEEPN